MQDHCLHHSYPALLLFCVLYSNFIPFFLIMQLEEMSTQFTVDKKEMEERHTLVQKMVGLTCTL